MKISVFIEDTGCTIEDDEPFDEDRLGAIIRIIGAGVLQLYEAALVSETDDLT